MIETLKTQPRTTGEIVAEDFRTAQIFTRHGIDFCCGGKTPLDQACREKGVDLAAVLKEIEAIRDTPSDPGQNYASWNPSFLADFIINTHHHYLKENLSIISAYANKIAEVHGERHPEALEIAKQFDALAADMKGHLREEEEVFFPLVKRLEAAEKAGLALDAGMASTFRSSLDKLAREHEIVGDEAHRIRHLTGDYRIPQDVCNTYAVTFRKLKEFEDDLHKHVHLENNILFPKAEKLSAR